MTGGGAGGGRVTRRRRRRRRAECDQGVIKKDGKAGVFVKASGGEEFHGAKVAGQVHCQRGPPHPSSSSSPASSAAALASPPPLRPASPCA
uniref:Uncharacterized protein n=1 Tax=Oryza rufipogon TaxID=4529 RepID=A0A0E0RBF1_ORYRU